MFYITICFMFTKNLRLNTELHSSSFIINYGLRFRTSCSSFLFSFPCWKLIFGNCLN